MIWQHRHTANDENKIKNIHTCFRFGIFELAAGPHLGCVRVAFLMETNAASNATNDDGILIHAYKHNNDLKATH